MDAVLESMCNKKEALDLEARVYAYTWVEEHLVQLITHFEEEEAEIVDMVEQDINRQLQDEVTVMEYADALYRVRRVIFHLRERYTNLTEDSSMTDLMSTFNTMST
jgi:hypothetical protein